MIIVWLFFDVGMGNDFLQTGLIPVAFDVWKSNEKKYHANVFSIFFQFVNRPQNRINKGCED